MKQFIIIVAVIITVLGGAWVLFTKENATSTNALSLGVLSMQEDTFDFGTISMKNGNVSHDFQVKNESQESVTIEKVYTSCMCTEAKLSTPPGKTYGPFGMPGHSGSSSAKIVVAPGETVTVQAVFDPAAHGPSGTGLAQRGVYLETNSQTESKVDLQFTATVTQ